MKAIKVERIFVKFLFFFCPGLGVWLTDRAVDRHVKVAWQRQANKAGLRESSVDKPWFPQTLVPVCSLEA